MLKTEERKLNLQQLLAFLIKTMSKIILKNRYQWMTNEKEMILHEKINRKYAVVSI
jgi:hypothetical protein